MDGGSVGASWHREFRRRKPQTVGGRRNTQEMRRGDYSCVERPFVDVHRLKTEAPRSLAGGRCEIHRRRHAKRPRAAGLVLDRDKVSRTACRREQDDPGFSLVHAPPSMDFL
jgi:hypothetical protein